MAKVPHLTESCDKKSTEGQPVQIFNQVPHFFSKTAEICYCHDTQRLQSGYGDQTLTNIQKWDRGTILTA